MSMKLKFIIFLSMISGLVLSGCSPKSLEIEDSSTYYLYFSDSMEKLKTTGTVVFSGEKTKVIKKTKGLELGKLNLNKEDVYFYDVNNLYKFDSEKKELSTKKRKFEEITGQYFSILDKQPLEVFNSGYNKHGDYITRFYFNNNILEINEFMKSMGQNDNTLFSIGELDDRDNYIVSKYVIKDGKMERIKLGEIPKDDDEFIIGDIMFFNDSLYTLYEKDKKIKLLEYNITSKNYSIIDMNTNMSVDDIPFGNSNFTVIKDNKFIFISSIGNLYQYDLIKKEMLNTYHLDLNFSTNFIVDWGLKDTAFVASYSDNQNILISSFDFNQFKIKTLKEIKTKSLIDDQNLYDFKVIRKHEKSTSVVK